MTTATEARTVNINGVDLRYVDTGSGEPALVFVHGWTCNRTNWAPQIAEFSTRHRVVAVDQRGHGESDKPDQDYTIDGFADDLAGLIAHLGPEKPVLVGHSMGGVIVHHLARTQPGLARALVLVDAPMVPVSEALEATVASVLDGLRSPAYKEVARGFSTSFMFNERCDPVQRDELLDSMVEAPQRLMHSALDSLLATASLHEGPMDIPALYLQAATSVYTPEQITERYPSFEVKRIDAGHFLQLERPDEVNTAIREFIARPEVQA